MNLSKGNYLYTGTVGHRRFTPFNHFFNYPLFMAYIDLNTVNHFLDKSWFWNVDKKAIISFNRKDYHGDPNLDLSRSVRKTVYETIGLEVKGPIRLLTHLSYFGYCFNPVSFYYCFDEEDTDVEAILAEVTNTPWKERHAYVIQNVGDEKKQLKSTFKKGAVALFFGGLFFFSTTFNGFLNKFLFVSETLPVSGINIRISFSFFSIFKFSILRLF